MKFKKYAIIKGYILCVGGIGMDYNKIKLGLIGRFKVWSTRREAEKTRAWRDKIEHENSEVDYSEAERLEADLLEQKRMKRATKDATRLYRRVYGKNNDGIGETDFIEDYLVENGLKQKALPEPSTSKKHSFMDQYPTEKSEEELAYEKANIQPKIYYRINGTEYELPSAFYQYSVRMANMDKFLPLEELENGNYILVDDKMKPHDKFDMLSSMLDITSTSAMGWINEYLLDLKDEQLEERKNSLCRKLGFHEYTAKKLSTEGKVDKANTILTSSIEEMLKFEQELLQSEQEESRE